VKEKGDWFTFSFKFLKPELKVKNYDDVELMISPVGLPLQVFEDLEKEVINYSAPILVKVKLFGVKTSGESGKRVEKNFLAEDRGVFCIMAVDDKTADLLNGGKLCVICDVLWTVAYGTRGAFFTNLFKETLVPVTLLPERNEVKDAIKKETGATLDTIVFPLKEGVEVFEKIARLVRERYANVEKALKDEVKKAERFVIGNLFAAMPEGLESLAVENDLSVKDLMYAYHAVVGRHLYQFLRDSFNKRTTLLSESLEDVVSKEKVREFLRDYLSFVETEEKNEVKFYRNKVDPFFKLSGALFGKLDVRKKDSLKAMNASRSKPKRSKPKMSFH